jgi:RNA polymerase sigma-54 factor
MSERRANPSAAALRDHLSEQLSDLKLSEADKALALHIISFIDRTGHLGRRNEKGQFLYATLVEIATTFDPPTTERRIEQVLHAVQRLDPRGVAARSFSECLLLQVEDDAPQRDLVRTIIQDHLEDVAHHRLPAIYKKTGANFNEVREVLEVIRHLNPRPGDRFSAGF